MMNEAMMNEAKVREVPSSVFVNLSVTEDNLQDFIRRLQVIATFLNGEDYPTDGPREALQSVRGKSQLICDLTGSIFSYLSTIEQSLGV